MEHSMSREGFERLTKFMDFIESCPQNEKPEWLKNFEHYMKTGNHLQSSMQDKSKKEK
jgi:Mn-dependent DtxR family transcriptional regulator